PDPLPRAGVEGVGRPRCDQQQQGTEDQQREADGEPDNEAADPGEEAAEVGPALLGDGAVDAGVEGDLGVLVAVFDVAGHFGARQQPGVAAGGGEVAFAPAGDGHVAAEDGHVAGDVAGDPGVAAGDEDAV